MGDAPSPPGREAAVARLRAELERQMAEQGIDWASDRWIWDEKGQRWLERLCGGRMRVGGKIDLAALADAALGRDAGREGEEGRPT